MITSILQLTAGILLAISSFVVKNIGLQIPIFGKKLPGSYDTFKQSWIVRFGLIFLVLGYAFPIINWDLEIHEKFPLIYRLLIGFGISFVLVFVFYKISSSLAKRDYDKSPVFDKNTPVPDGTIAFDTEE